MYDVGCAMCDVGCAMWDVRCRMYDDRMNNVGGTIFDVRCWNINVVCVARTVLQYNLS